MRPARHLKSFSPFGATSRHIEENLALDGNVSVLVELKRIIFLRIADLESPIGDL